MNRVQTSNNLISKHFDHFVAKYRLLRLSLFGKQVIFIYKTPNFKKSLTKNVHLFQ